MNQPQAVPSAEHPLLGRLYALGWLVMVVLLLAPWVWLTPEKPQAKSMPLADPAALSAKALWADEQVLNASWSERARQWQQTNPVSPQTDLALGRAWENLHSSVFALQDRTSQVLQIQQLQRAKLLLEPYARKGHPDIQRLANSLQSHVQSLLSQAPAGPNVPTLVLTWGNLGKIVDDLNQIQLELMEIRRWSISNTVAYDDKLPLRFHEQMALIFPNLYVQQFENQANLLFNSRLTIENAMTQAQLQAFLKSSSEPVNSSNLTWLVAFVCLLLGAGWLLVLGRALAHDRNLLALRAKDIQAMQVQLKKTMALPVVDVATPMRPEPAAVPEIWKQLQADVPDLLGRVKTIQHLFDTGRSQEWVVRDLAILEAKLTQWDKANQTRSKSTDGEPNA